MENNKKCTEIDEMINCNNASKNKLEMFIIKDKLITLEYYNFFSCDVCHNKLSGSTTNKIKSLKIDNGAKEIIKKIKESGEIFIKYDKKMINWSKKLTKLGLIVPIEGKKDWYSIVENVIFLI